MLFTTTIKQRYYLEQDANDRHDKKKPKKRKIKFDLFSSGAMYGSEWGRRRKSKLLHSHSKITINVPWTTRQR